MLIRAVSTTATLVGAAFLMPVSLPVLISAAVLLVLVPLSLVLWALRKKDHVRAGLRLGRWYEFSLDAGDDSLKNRRKK
jgi:hypothetical protein